MIRRRVSGMTVIAMLLAAMFALSSVAGASIWCWRTRGSDDKAGDDHGGHGGHGSDDASSGGIFGAWVYEGTCDRLAASPLKEIGGLEQESDADDLAVLDLPDPVPSTVWMEDEDIDLTVSDLTATPHAVVVRASEDGRSAVIACGVVTNAPVGDAPFAFPLDTVGDSGYRGKVIVSSRIDNHEVDLVVGLWEGTSTPAA